MNERGWLTHDVTRRTFVGGTATGFLLASAPAIGRVSADSEVTSSGSPTLSVSDRLGDRRYVTAGNRAYIVGTQTGRFPAMGWHITGEMGGIWSPPLKLVDGIWFGIDDEWIGPTTQFESGYGHVNMDLPGQGDLDISRTDFVPSDHRAVLIGLSFTAGDTDESFTLKVDTHSELMAAYPWGGTDPSQTAFNLDDSVQFDGTRLVFREQGQPHPNAETHDWAAVVGSSRQPTRYETGRCYFGPQDDESVDSKTGRGKGGQLRYDITVPANHTETIWFAVAGAERHPDDSESAPEAARAEHAAVLDDPDGTLDRTIEERLALGTHTCLDLPGDRQLQRAIEWGKQNLADCVQEAHDVKLRYVDEGNQYPEPVETLSRMRFIGAGFPDYPWLFATDGEYTAFASVAVGQFEPIKDHLRALREVSEIINDGSGKVVHEVVTDGSVYFGANSDPGNIDETAKFPSAVALVWRWSGDDTFRDELYEFTKKNMKYIFSAVDDDGDFWPEGLGNVERPGMGEEKLDVAAYTIRGLYDLADMAKSKDDAQTFQWANTRASKMYRKFEDTWWIPAIPQHAGSLRNPDNERVYQRHWIGVTPMEISLHHHNRYDPGLTTSEHGTAALDLRETDCYGGIGDDENSDERRNEGLYHTGAPGCDRGTFEGTEDKAERSIFTLNTAIMAVGEGNYGRLGPDQQRRFTTANAKLQLPIPDEQPGAMPEIAPSPNYSRSINLPLTERAMVLQAWGNYGTIWPVVNQQLGVRPDMGRACLEVTPQVPPDSPGLSGKNIQIGGGSVDVSTAADGDVYRTTIHPHAELTQLVIGHTVPDCAEVSSVTLDGENVSFEIRETNRGQEVIVEGKTDGEQTLIVRT